MKGELGRVSGETFDAAVLTQFDAELVSFAEETVDYRLRVISRREHATVGFALDLNATFAKPGDGVLWLPMVKGGTQFTGAARVVRGKLGRIKTTVGDVAASAAGYLQFTQKLRAAFKDDDTLGLVGFSSGEGGEEAGGTAADNCYGFHGLGADTFSPDLAGCLTKLLLELT